VMCFGSSYAQAASLETMSQLSCFMTEHDRKE